MQPIHEPSVSAHACERYCERIARKQLDWRDVTETILDDFVAYWVARGAISINHHNGMHIKALRGVITTVVPDTVPTGKAASAIQFWESA